MGVQRAANRAEEINSVNLYTIDPVWYFTSRHAAATIRFSPDPQVNDAV